MELEKLIVKLTADISQFKSSMSDAEKIATSSTSNIGANAGKTFKTVGKVAAAGLTAIIGAGTAAVAMATDWNGKLDEMMDKTGANAEEAAGLVSMQERLGGSMEDLSKMLVFMGKDAAKADGYIAQLGISTMDSSGQMLSSAEIFQQVSDKLALMPDGIEKTNLMMGIFGKTGSEMGDLLGEASNGGLQTYIDRAKELGLATDPQKAIEFGKAQMDLQQTLQGLAVTVGTNLLPALTPLISTLADLAAKYLPPIVNFIQKNFVPILIVLAAAFLVWAVNAGIAAVSTIAALSPIILVIMAIAAVVALLVAAWMNDWGGIRTFMTDLWENKLKPIFTAVKTWFEVNIPKAIQALVNFWNNTLKPVFNAIKGAFDGIGNAIKGVIDWVKRLIDKLSNISLPSWLTPGSPTPFEIGLRGISSAMKEASLHVLPTYTAQLNMAGVTNPTAGKSNTGNTDIIRLLTELNSKKDLNVDELAFAIRDAILQVV